jgi:hypothetical protein
MKALCASRTPHRRRSTWHRCFRSGSRGSAIRGRREWVERKCRRDANEIVRGWALLLDHALELADEAYALTSRLSQGH